MKELLRVILEIMQFVRSTPTDTVGVIGFNKSHRYYKKTDPTNVSRPQNGVRSHTEILYLVNSQVKNNLRCNLVLENRRCRSRR